MIAEIGQIKPIFLLFFGISFWVFLLDFEEAVKIHSQCEMVIGLWFLIGGEGSENRETRIYLLVRTQNSQ